MAEPRFRWSDLPDGVLVALEAMLSEKAPECHPAPVSDLNALNFQLGRRSIAREAMAEIRRRAAEKEAKGAVDAGPAHP